VQRSVGPQHHCLINNVNMNWW